MHGKNYRAAVGQPYTRKEFIHGSPQPKIARFTTGNPSDAYDHVYRLVSLERAQIRHNALEACRISVNKIATTLGETNYFLAIRVYPHVILKENKMIATAGADRLQEGMRKSFGKPTGLAARVNRGTVILELGIKGKAVKDAQDALRVAASKLPVQTRVEEVGVAAKASGA
ncbi:MAG: 50S ribosomal protein L16 [Nitrososphaerota archaeon]|nr:50S ribosomal protein L16 [Nitrososphaerota archaeon]MDG6939208.1 50S ribosomal protein L16 [Nitrososphaerota archaeon]